MKTPKEQTKNAPSRRPSAAGSAHLMRVDYEDGTGFWVHRDSVPIAGTKAEMGTLAKTVSWAGGTVRVVMASAPNAALSQAATTQKEQYG